MAVSATAGFLSRLTNARNVVRNISNNPNITGSSACNFALVTRKYSVDINSVIDTGENVSEPKKKMSKAMRAYLQRAKDHDEFLKKEITEYEIGKRHLANMMGENPDTFSQADINKSIRYLFPSALYDRKARPLMAEPEKLYPPRKAAEFKESGRPLHPLFYTCKPNYYQALHDIVSHTYELNRIEDEALKKRVTLRPEDKLDISDTEWLTKEGLSSLVLENIGEEDWEKFIAAAQRLSDHPFAFQAKNFILKFRRPKIVQSMALSVIPLKYKADGRPYVTVRNCKRKSARATVTVFGKGQGNITINDEDIRYFLDEQARQQIPHLGDQRAPIG